MNNYLSFQEFIKLHEMPLTGFHKVGDWRDGKPVQYGYQKYDIPYLTNPKKIEKLYTAWKKTKYNFEIYLISHPDGIKNKFRSRFTTSKEISEKFGLNIEPKPNAITVILTTNVIEKSYPLTPWMIAHRAGHAILTHHAVKFFIKFDIGKNYYSFDTYPFYIMKELFQILMPHDGEVLQHLSKSFRLDFYHVESLFSKYILPHIIGSMKSARLGRIDSLDEFMYDLFAQYLITGKVVFNRFNELFIDLNKYCNTRFLKSYCKDVEDPKKLIIELNEEDINKANEYLQSLEQNIVENFENILEKSIGKMYMD